MFADGGAFTNSVVSKPTAFGMANGKTGIMGLIMLPFEYSCQPRLYFLPVQG